MGWWRGGRTMATQSHEPSPFTGNRLPLVVEAIPIFLQSATMMRTAERGWGWGGGGGGFRGMGGVY